MNKRTLNSTILILLFSVLAGVWVNNWNDSPDSMQYSSKLPSTVHDNLNQSPSTSGSQFTDNSLSEQSEVTGEKILLLPHTSYQQYLSDAESGSPEAQFYISAALGRCSAVSIRTEQEIDEIETIGEFSGEFIQQIKRTLRECKPLYALLGEVDINELRQAWLESSAAGGHHVAKILSLFEYPEPPDQAEALMVLYAALEQSKGNPILEEKSYAAALKFYSIYIEPSNISYGAVDHRRSNDRNAWDYLACQKSITCDIDEFTNLVGEHFYEYEVSEMVARASEISAAIIGMQWEKLGLESDDGDIK